MNTKALIVRLEQDGVLVLFDDENDEFYWLNVRSDRGRPDVGFETEREAAVDAAEAHGIIAC